MDPIEQQYQQPLPQHAPTKRMTPTLWILVVLVVIAILLSLLTDATTDMREESAMPYAEDSYIMSDEATPGAGENPAATEQESAAIRADLESSDTDGVSDGI